ncbi:MAG: hypothetical protein ABIE03_01140 [Patescibacteria group bacterium]
MWATTLANQRLNGSALEDGINWITRNIVSVLAQSVSHIFPSGAGNFNCPIFSDTSKYPSSAALVVCMSALAQKLAKKEFNLEEINKIAYEIEKKQHGKPSGGDNTIVSYGGFVCHQASGNAGQDFCPSGQKLLLKKGSHFVQNYDTKEVL